jgi:ABC-type transport system involved in multi-copper enzyme maturation permease subunit
MLGITDYLWRLVPANPILLRVVEAGGRRRRDLFVRCGYLGLLILVVIVSLMGSGGSSGSAGLSELAKTSGHIFQQMSYLQLALVALLAPIFTAGAITQEKDSQTYDILLSTPLTNGQIVLGSLLSRLFFVVALLISGIPIFSITQMFGGVAISSIGLSFGIAAATAFVTGAIAMAIATFKVGTRRTIFSFYLFIVIYLVGGYLLDALPAFHPLDSKGVPIGTSWLTGIHPFLALRAIFNDPSYLAPDLGRLPPSLQGWPWGWYLTRPAAFFITFMFVISLLMVAPSVVLLRRVAQSTVKWRALVLAKLKIVKADRVRKPRTVWGNPIAWREAKTKASAARASILRYGFIAAGLVGALVLVWRYASVQSMPRSITGSSYNASAGELTIYDAKGSATTYALSPDVAVNYQGHTLPPGALNASYEVLGNLGVNRTVRGPVLTSITLGDVPRGLTAAQARCWLLGAVIVEFAVILLIVTNAAASTVTREKEDGSLDLLLTTPITSRYYIWGKLRGLVSYVLPLVAVPVLSVLFFVLYDFFAGLGSDEANRAWVVFWEAPLVMPGMLVIVVAFASILGMQMSLRCRTTVTAVMGSVGIVVGICAALGWCGFQMLTPRMGGSEINLIVGTFSPFTLLTLLIDPYQYGGQSFGTAVDVTTARVLIFLFAWAATGAYALVVWSMYKSMVKNFDMTIRRQSR